MTKTDYGGSLLRWFRSWAARPRLKLSSEEATRVDKGFFDFLSFYDGWALGQRKVPNDCASQFIPFLDEPWIGEHYAEHWESGVRLGIFFDVEGNIIGRLYFDKGDKTTSEVRNLLSGWESLIKQGRPLKDSPLPVTDEEIYDLITSREEWYQAGAIGKEYKPTIRDAAEQLIEKFSLVDDPESDDYNIALKQILMAYERAKKRAKEKDDNFFP